MSIAIDDSLESPLTDNQVICSRVHVSIYKMYIIDVSAYGM